MGKIDVHTAPEGLVAVPVASKADAIEAYFYTFTQAQHLARAADPDPRSPAYFDAMLAALAPLGWHTVVASSLVSPPQQARPVPFVALAGAIADIIVGFGIPVAPQAITGPAEALAQQLLAAPEDVTRTLDAWWSGINTSASSRVMALAPIFQPFGQPLVTLCWIEFAIAGDSWRALLQPAENFSFVVRPVLMSLDLRAYDKVAAGLKAELVAELRDHIASTTVDLAKMMVEASG